ncbi:MAG: hypothetical protein C5B54_03315 [Acidobacteria bacterium]|nr:MAG: hypothetical protein C5B54_03315 [Acidobacteriota bacterium]
MKNMLLIDDDPFSMKMLENHFRSDWKIYNETTTDQIRAILKKEKIDLVILNAGIRRTDGQPMFDAVHSTSPAIPVIVYTPTNLVRLGRDLVRQGAFWHLQMPLNMDDLERLINICVNIDTLRSKAIETQQDYARLEKGIARMSVPLTESLPQRFTFDQDDLIQAIIDLLADILQVERISLMLLDKKTNELRIKAAKGLTETVIRNTTKKMGEGIAGWVAREGRPLFIRDVAQDPEFSESAFYAQYSTKSLICVPLKAGETVVGVLSANNKWSGDSFDEHDLYLTTIFSHVLLFTLLSAQLHFDRERTLMRETKLSALHRKITSTLEPKVLYHSLLDECSTIFEADFAFLFVLDEKGTALNSYHLIGNQFKETKLPNSSLGSWLAARHQSVLLSSEEARPEFAILEDLVEHRVRCWLSAPIVLQDKLIGSLELASNDVKRFKEADRQLLAGVGQQASLAINNSRLYGKLLHSIQEISEARKEVERVRRGQFL